MPIRLIERTELGKHVQASVRVGDTVLLKDNSAWIVVAIQGAFLEVKAA